MGPEFATALMPRSVLEDVHQEMFDKHGRILTDDELRKVAETSSPLTTFASRRSQIMRANCRVCSTGWKRRRSPAPALAPMLEELQKIDIRLDEITARTAEIEQSVVARKAARGCRLNARETDFSSPGAHHAAAPLRFPLMAYGLLSHNGY